MIQALLARAGLKAANALVPAALLIGGLALAGLLFWRGTIAIERMVDAARVETRAARDAFWQAEIAGANARVEAERAAQAATSAAAEARARDDIERLQAALTTMETANAALPNGAACGLGRDRVRLLNGR